MNEADGPAEGGRATHPLQSSGAGLSSRDEAPWTADVITLVPGFWAAALGPDTGLLGQAFARGLARLRLTHLRDFGEGKHRQVDDVPYGGGAGMVLMAPPVARAIAYARARQQGPLVALTPRGCKLDQRVARQLAAAPGAIFLCGRYEGIDERILRRADLEVSVGDLVLTGGDPAALCLVDAAVRLLPGVLGNADSLVQESFAPDSPGLEHPHYTRPADFEGERVPTVLRSGDHAAIARWRREAGRQLTAERRPDLLPADPSSVAREALKPSNSWSPSLAAAGLPVVRGERSAASVVGPRTLGDQSDGPVAKNLG